MARWKRPDKLPPMDSMGVDVAMTGDDEHVILRRHRMWIDEPIAHKGQQIPDGAASGSQVVAALRDAAVIHLDLFGVGSLTYGFLTSLHLQVIGVNFGDLVNEATDQTGRLKFSNLRSFLWWRAREVLNPLNNTGIALPPHRRLLADLCAPKYAVVNQRIKVQSRDDIVKELGRSPDYGTALILALIDTPKIETLRAIAGKNVEIIVTSVLQTTAGKFGWMTSMRRYVSMPLMPGRSTSRSTASGRGCSARCPSASSPLVASTTS